MTVAVPESVSGSPVILSALVVAHNEEHQLADCLAPLRFADEIVVVLDRCTDRSQAIATALADQVIEGAWEIEGDRRNTGIAACRGQWIVEVDADERLDPPLAREIRSVIATSVHAIHDIPVDNYIGARLVRHGWGASYGTTACPRVCRKGTKVWGRERVHPALVFHGTRGPRLQNPLRHYVDRDISDMIHRLDRYASARARDLRDKRQRNEGRRETFATNLRRLFSRFFKCYVLRKGYREGGYGFLIALFAGLYPLLSYLKATLEDGTDCHGR